MKVVGLDGREHSWIPSNRAIEKSKQSSLHSLARKILKDKYPNDRILEEVVLPGTSTGSRKSLLVADFFVPLRNLIVEVHGSQHTEFNNFFFKTKMDFYKAQARDRDKKRWCELNGFVLVELFHDETEEQWKEKI